MKKFDYRSLYKLLRMVVVLVLLYRPLGFDSLTASECCEKIAVTDMAGRTVYVPKEVTKVLAAGHCATITATFAPEKVAGGLARSDMQKALLPESWWAEPAPAPTAPPANPQQPAPDKKAMFGNDSVRIARTKAQVEKYNANLIIQELTAGAVERAEKMQAATGVPVVLVDLSIPRYKEAFALLGKCLANEEHSAALIDFLTKYIDPIGEKAKTIPDAKRVKVYYAEGKDGLRSEPAGSNHTEVMEYAGAIKIGRAHV